MNRRVVSWSASQSQLSSAPSPAYQESVSVSHWCWCYLDSFLTPRAVFCWATQSNNKTFILSSVREVVSLEKWRCRKALCVSMCACLDQQKKKRKKKIILENERALSHRGVLNKMSTASRFTVHCQQKRSRQTCTRGIMCENGFGWCSKIQKLKNKPKGEIKDMRVKNRRRGGKAEIFFGRGVSIGGVHTHRALGNLRQGETIMFNIYMNLSQTNHLKCCQLKKSRGWWWV